MHCVRRSIVECLPRGHLFAIPNVTTQSTVNGRYINHFALSGSRRTKGLTIGYSRSERRANLSAGPADSISHRTVNELLQPDAQVLGQAFRRCRQAETDSTTELPMCCRPNYMSLAVMLSNSPQTANVAFATDGPRATA